MTKARRSTAVVLAALLWLAHGEPFSRAGDEKPADEALAALIDEAWQFELSEDPLLATWAGDHRWNDRLPRVSLGDARRREQARQDFQARLARIDRAALPAAAQLNYDVFSVVLAQWLGDDQYQAYLMPITNRSGFHLDFPELPRQMPLETLADYEAYVARLRGFRTWAEQHVELLREAMAAHMTLPAVVLEGYAEPLEAQLVDDARQSLLYRPLDELPGDIQPADQQRLRGAAAEAIQQSVVPGYRLFLDFLRQEYVPAARGTIACSVLPRGREYYRHLVKKHTTLDVAPEVVHETGLAEVRRIRAEMDEVIRRSGFDGDFAAFVDFLRQEPKFYATSGEELLEKVSRVLKRIDGELPRLFGRLPRTPYGVREVPAYVAPRTTTAYYQPPAGDGTRAGFYYVNTYDLKSRPLYELEALSLHEAVPGHHLQLALQQELSEVPAFRRFTHFTAFVEGWGLYSERLGLELGFYEDPYSDFGRLSYEMWRACRLVVDSGMHYLGWSREQAIDFMAENTALALHNIRTEVDRYIAWPGQALAYKMGELKIRQLRCEAEERLGPRFDVRAFHDRLLDQGSLPLTVLESRMQSWLDEQAAGGTPAGG